MVACNLGRQNTNTILEKLEKMEETYNVLITTILTSNAKGREKKKNLGKTIKSWMLLKK
jgi:hypothetical protein